MKWQEVRERFPHRWVVLEALRSRREEGKWIIDDMAVVDEYLDGTTAIKAYGTLHKQWPMRELLFFSTEHAKIELTETRWMGLRPGQ